MFILQHFICGQLSRNHISHVGAILILEYIQKHPKIGVDSVDLGVRWEQHCVLEVDTQSIYRNRLYLIYMHVLFDRFIQDDLKNN